MKIARRGFLKLLGVAPVAVPAALSRIQQTLVSGYANGTGVGAAATQKVGHVAEQIVLAVDEGYDSSGFAIQNLTSVATPITVTSAERFIPEIWAQGRDERGGSHERHPARHREVRRPPQHPAHRQPHGQRSQQHHQPLTQTPRPGLPGRGVHAC